MLDDRDFSDALTLPSAEDRSPGELSKDDAASAELPEWIGRYRVVRRLGAGGMGVVFEAEQQNPRRRVAVKVVRGGLFVDEALVKSFKREARTLALLDHPGIATIYESGRTDEGEHFFAMELVRGTTLDAFLHARRVDSAEIRFRLALFATMVDAVHYAHQRGVIHRDLKPSNIIVGDPETVGGLSFSVTARDGPFDLPPLKILDFGLARITDKDAVAASTMTATGVIQGTLSYMSPEQARGESDAVDVRSDVYSLGVVLYEMLTGRRPYDLSRGSVVESLRIVCEQPPMSLRQGANEGSAFDLDLETIVGRALEKNADRRYESAAALGADVRRYLASQPILARPPTALYQLRKFAQRNRALVGGLITTAIVLVGGIVVSSSLAVREAKQRQAAEEARSELEAVVDYQTQMLRELDPGRMGRSLLLDLRERVERAARWRTGSAEAAEEAVAALDRLIVGVNPTDLALELVDVNILREASADAGELFGDQPLVEAELRHILGEIYDELSLSREAEEQTVRALALRERELGRGHPTTLESIRRLALELMSQFRADPAERAARRRRAGELFEEVVARRRGLLGDRHPDTLQSIDDLARLTWYQGDFERAEALYDEVIPASREVLGVDHERTHQSMFEMACMFAWSERPEEAEALFLETLALQQDRAVDPFGTHATMRELGRLYFDLGRWAEAEELLLQVLDGWGALLGSSHSYTLRTGIGLGEIYLDQGRFGAAERQLAKALDIVRATPDINRLHVLELWQLLGDLYSATERQERATDAYAEARALATTLLDEGHFRRLELAMSGPGRARQAPAVPARFAMKVGAQSAALAVADDAGSLAAAVASFEAARTRFRGKPGEAGLAAHVDRLRRRATELEAAPETVQ